MSTDRVRTRLTGMFDIRYPIVCGSMMWLGVPRTCEIVADAGGIGTLTSAIYKTEDEYRAAVVETKRRLQGRSFLVGLTIGPTSTMTMAHYEMYLRVCRQERVPGMEVSGRALDQAFGPGVIDDLHRAGTRIFHKVGSLRHALHAEKVGYDGVYAAGFEEAGHPHKDDVTTMVLTPRIASTVKIPVVAVGGIANGKTMAAALSLGAEGVMMATRFLATRDCVAIHENFRDELLRRQENDARIVGKSTGVQCRVLDNDVAKEIDRLEAAGASLAQLLPRMSGQRNREAWVSGDLNHGMHSIGQSVGLVEDIPTTAELLARMVREARSELNRAVSMFD